jgi:hypothetical protein
MDGMRAFEWIMILKNAKSPIHSATTPKLLSGILQGITGKYATLESAVKPRPGSRNRAFSHSGAFSKKFRKTPESVNLRASLKNGG